MKKTEVIEILDYMFEFLFSSASEGEPLDINDTEIKSYLLDAGFDVKNVENALDYLKNMAESGEVEVVGTANSGIRLYDSTEKSKLGVSGVGLLTYLDNNNSLKPAVRELVIEQVLQLPYECGTEELLWMVESAILNEENEYLPEMLNTMDFESDSKGTRH